AKNYAIGKGNKLLWSLPADLKFFKNLTTGHTVIMGKRTFESLPNGPLPNRKNIVLRSILSDGVTQGYFEAESLDEALELAENESHIFIIGGATVYKQSIDKVNSMYITWVDGEFDADTYFPQFNFAEWKEVSREDHPADEKNKYAYSFVEYQRI
ncbi:dihydrofolate reductase, partial [Paludibacteraceae bacterium OttesenSCG-928-F17]|nr:dihydrofolate reductase [Paludibacteraceae bacterium OttesenSCG-928-F17]